MNKPKPQPRSKMPSAPPTDISPDDFAELPNVPLDLPDVPTAADRTTPDETKPDNDDIDFDDLSRRFDELKKRNK